MQPHIMTYYEYLNAVAAFTAIKWQLRIIPLHQALSEVESARVLLRGYNNPRGAAVVLRLIHLPSNHVHIEERISVLAEMLVPFDGVERPLPRIAAA